MKLLKNLLFLLAITCTIALSAERPQRITNIHALHYGVIPKPQDFYQKSLTLTNSLQLGWHKTIKEIGEKTKSVLEDSTGIRFIYYIPEDLESPADYFFYITVKDEKKLEDAALKEIFPNHKKVGNTFISVNDKNNLATAEKLQTDVMKLTTTKDFVYIFDYENENAVLTQLFDEEAKEDEEDTEPASIRNLRNQRSLGVLTLNVSQTGVELDFDFFAKENSNLAIALKQPTTSNATKLLAYTGNGNHSQTTLSLDLSQLKAVAQDSLKALIDDIDTDEDEKQNLKEANKPLQELFTHGIVEIAVTQGLKLATSEKDLPEKQLKALIKVKDANKFLDLVLKLSPLFEFLEVAETLEEISGYYFTDMEIKKVEIFETLQVYQNTAEYDKLLRNDKPYFMADQEYIYVASTLNDLKKLYNDVKKNNVPENIKTESTTEKTQNHNEAAFLQIKHNLHYLLHRLELLNNTTLQKLITNHKSSLPLKISLEGDGHFKASFFIDHNSLSELSQILSTEATDQDKNKK